MGPVVAPDRPDHPVRRGSREARGQRETRSQGRHGGDGQGRSPGEAGCARRRRTDVERPSARPGRNPGQVARILHELEVQLTRIAQLQAKGTCAPRCN